MDVTDEMRRAVYAADCDQLGHLMDISQAISNNPDEHGINTIRVRAEDSDTVPHLLCKRCSQVWLIVDPGVDYDTAEAALNERLLPKFRRQLRKQRRQAAQDARDAAATASTPAV